MDTGHDQGQQSAGSRSVTPVPRTVAGLHFLQKQPRHECEHHCFPTCTEQTRSCRILRSNARKDITSFVSLWLLPTDAWHAELITSTVTNLSARGCCRPTREARRRTNARRRAHHTFCQPAAAADPREWHDAGRVRDVLANEDARAEQVQKHGDMEACTSWNINWDRKPAPAMIPRRVACPGTAPTHLPPSILHRLHSGSCRRLAAAGGRTPLHRPGSARQQ